jgi:group I intron endonuclease
MILIYKITNSVNGKVYIGLTTTSLKKRMSNHVRHSRKIKPNQRIHQAIAKHGKENFLIEQIDFSKTEQEANDREIYWIEHYNSTQYEKGYNMSKGGSGSKKVQAHRDSMTEQQKKDMTKNANLSKTGMKESAESKKLKSDAQNKIWSNITKEKRLERGQKSKAGVSKENKIKQISVLLNSVSPARQKGFKNRLIRCPYCKKEGGANAMPRYHFENCKEK